MERLREIAFLLYRTVIRPTMAVAATLGIVLTVGLLASQPVADIFKVAISLFVLAYASYRDVKQRIVPNKVWLLMLLVGLSFVLYDILTSGTPDILRVAWSFGITSALCYLFYRFGLFGGADAKSLICIAVIFPVHPQFTILSQQFPIYGGGPAVFPPAVAAILYGSFLALVVPIFLLFHNLRKSGIKAVLSSTGRAFLGYRVPLDQLAACRNVKLMDVYQESNGSVRRRFSLGGIRVDAASLEMLQRYHREGQIREEVWVTLDLPFLVFITCGFVIATFLGQPVTIFLS